MLFEVWGTCLLPIPAPHRHIAWFSQGPFLCLLTGWWMPQSMIAANDSCDPQMDPPALTRPDASLVRAEPPVSRRARPRLVARRAAMGASPERAGSRRRESG